MKTLMQIKVWSSSLILFFLGALIASQPISAQNRAQGDFFCGKDGETPATIVNHSARGQIVFIKWLRDFAPGSEWTPNKRCDQVSQKLDLNQKSGALVYIVPGKTNGLPVLCAAKIVPGEIIDCPDEQVLMTLRKNDNAQALIDELVLVNTNRFALPLGHNAYIEKNGKVRAIRVEQFTNLLKPPVKSLLKPPVRLQNCNTVLFGGCQLR